MHLDKDKAFCAYLLEAAATPTSRMHGNMWAVMVILFETDIAIFGCEGSINK